MIVEGGGGIRLLGMFSISLPLTEGEREVWGGVSGDVRLTLCCNSFFKGNKLDYPNQDTSKASKKYVKAMKHLSVCSYPISSLSLSLPLSTLPMPPPLTLHPPSSLPSQRAQTNIYSDAQDVIPPQSPFNKQFLDLLRRIFVYDPRRRITAKEALKHPWFSEAVRDDGTEALKLRLAKEEERRGRGRGAGTGRWDGGDDDDDGEEGDEDEDGGDGDGDGEGEGEEGEGSEEYQDE